MAALANSIGYDSRRIDRHESFRQVTELKRNTSIESSVTDAHATTSVHFSLLLQAQISCLPGTSLFQNHIYQDIKINITHHRLFMPIDLEAGVLWMQR